MDSKDDVCVLRASRLGKVYQADWFGSAEKGVLGFANICQVCKEPNVINNESLGWKFVD